MRIVITQNPLSAGRVQRKRIPDPMRDVLAWLNFPSLDLEPIAVLLVDDLVMQIKKGTDLMIFRIHSISPVDIYLLWSPPFS